MPKLPKSKVLSHFCTWTVDLNLHQITVWLYAQLSWAAQCWHVNPCCINLAKAQDQWCRKWGACLMESENTVYCVLAGNFHCPSKFLIAPQKRTDSFIQLQTLVQGLTALKGPLRAGHIGSGLGAGFWGSPWKNGYLASRFQGNALTPEPKISGVPLDSWAGAWQI